MAFPLTRTLLVYALFSMACGPSPTNRQIDPAFTPIFLEFMSYASDHSAVIDPLFSDNVKIQFSHLSYSDGTKGNIVGYCTYATVAIQIDPVYWSISDKWTQEALLFHELGHCLLRLEHNPTMITTGLPITMLNASGGSYFTQAPMSIMNPGPPNSDLFNEKTLSYYVDELFNEGHQVLPSN